MAKTSEKLLLKETLLKDREDIMKSIIEHPEDKEALLKQLNLVDKYIKICTDRNRF